MFARNSIRILSEGRAFLQHATGLRFVAFAIVSISISFIFDAAPAAAQTQAQAHVQAGATIENTAQLTYTSAGITRTQPSNTIHTLVHEVLDLSLTALEPEGVCGSAAQENVVLRFRLNNLGNSAERFTLTLESNLSADDFDPLNARIYVDTNGDGEFSLADDAALQNGDATAPVQAGASVVIFIVATMPANVVDGQEALVRLRAHAATGIGVSGSVFSNLGNANVDAIIGLSSADANTTGRYGTQAIEAELIKSATILDPLGTNRPMQGATMRYALRARFVEGSTQAASIADPIPSNVIYRAGSIRLDGVALTDAADGDAGRIDNGIVRVDLGPISGATEHVVTFEVEIP